jgi:hypothetical protein
MDETPEEWLEQLFEFEYCAECGGDAEDHEVCVVPGMGTFFARCKPPGEGPPPRSTGSDPTAWRGRTRRQQSDDMTPPPRG